MRPFYVNDRGVINLDQVARWAQRSRHYPGSKPDQVLEVFTSDGHTTALQGRLIEEFKKEIDAMVRQEAHQARLR